MRFKILLDEPDRERIRNIKREIAFIIYLINLYLVIPWNDIVPVKLKTFHEKFHLPT